MLDILVVFARLSEEATEHAWWARFPHGWTSAACVGIAGIEEDSWLSEPDGEDVPLLRRVVGDH
jgi:hypothetical protein